MKLWQVKELNLEFLSSVAVLKHAIHKKVFVRPHVDHGHILLLIACVALLLFDRFLVLTADLLQLLGCD